MLVVRISNLIRSVLIFVSSSNLKSDFAIWRICDLKNIKHQNFSFWVSIFKSQVRQGFLTYRFEFRTTNKNDDRSNLDRKADRNSHSNRTPGSFNSYSNYDSPDIYWMNQIRFVVIFVSSSSLTLKVSNPYLTWG